MLLSVDITASVSVFIDDKQLHFMHILHCKFENEISAWEESH